MTKIIDILQTYSDEELAFMYKYKYDTYMTSTKKKIDVFLAKKGLTEEKLNYIIDKSKKHKKNDNKKRCPRCNSEKLLETNEMRWVSTEIVMLDWNKSEEVTKIVCQVCGYIVQDLNQVYTDFSDIIKRIFKKKK